ncbi:hypothetical protein HK097_006262 [Rhizophlyctis rosea]|uniref:Uncharacterized protein n=1 Tax=Rhizophlyctis rosea TaxID=64517 RepID=A0AAD5S154_9FUNG|nr:hypothetical protein HK097_006262 [Rhizophlyctis rosea]
MSEGNRIRTFDNSWGFFKGDYSMAIPEPEEVGGLSTIPQKEKNTPPEHYHDQPLMERAERENTTTEELHALNAANKREIDNEALASMGSSVQNFVGAGYDPKNGNRSTTNRDATPESKMGIVEPVRVRDARESGEANLDGHRGARTGGANQ